MMCIYNDLNTEVNTEIIQKWCLAWVFIAKHYVKPYIFKMTHLPFKTLIREKNAKVWSHIF
jgi:hypothetical protein